MQENARYRFSVGQSRRRADTRAEHSRNVGKTPPHVIVRRQVDPVGVEQGHRSCAKVTFEGGTTTSRRIQSSSSAVQETPSSAPSRGRPKGGISAEVASRHVATLVWSRGHHDNQPFSSGSLHRPAPHMQRHRFGRYHGSLRDLTER